MKEAKINMYGRSNLEYLFKMKFKQEDTVKSGITNKIHLKLRDKLFRMNEKFKNVHNDS